jgi:hypothetical protein
MPGHNAVACSHRTACQSHARTTARSRHRATLGITGKRSPTARHRHLVQHSFMHRRVPKVSASTTLHAMLPKLQKFRVRRCTPAESVHMDGKPHGNTDLDAAGDCAVGAGTGMGAKGL